MAIFTADELSNWLGYPVQSDTAATVEKVVSGWLLDALDRDSLPIADMGSRLWSWAIELAGIAYENPTSMSSDSTADQATSWSPARKDAILAAVARWGRRLTNPDGIDGASPMPRGSFPPAQHWPEPTAALLRRCP